MLGAGHVLDGKFRIVRLVGEGGMGAVYEAEHVFLGKRVAVKLVAPEFAHDAQAVQRFYREAQAAARIGHENILDVTDVAQAEDGRPYIVMELLHGKSLANAIVESAPFPVGRVVDITTQVLEALQAAHDAGIVHRDMKPDNVFLTRIAGRDDFVKVLDFGISKVRCAGKGSVQLTQTGTVLGTPAYMSPEQARGESDVDGRADIWAVGVMVYEMLTGRVPFEGDNYNKIIFAVAAGPIPRPRSLRQGITPELDAVVMRALERDLDRRHPTASAFRDDLTSAWMGVGESGFALRPSSPPPFGEEATEVASYVLPLETPEPARARPQAPSVQSVVSTPAGGSSARVPTVPHGVAARVPPVELRSARLGTVEATPGATVARLGPATSVPPRARRIPVVPAVVAGLMLVGIVALVLVRGLGQPERSSETDVAKSAAAPVAIVPPAAAATSPPPPAAPRPDTGLPGGVETQAKPSPTVVDTRPASTGAAAVDAGPPAVPPAAPEPAGPSALVRDGSARTPTRVRDAGTTVAVEPAAPATTGTLTVITVPPTQVFIDDAPFGRAPFARKEIAVGPHRIRYLSEERSIRFEERLMIVAGRLTEIHRTAAQLGAAAGRADAGAGPAPDAGGIPAGIRIRTGYGRDGG